MTLRGIAPRARLAPPMMRTGALLVLAACLVGCAVPKRDEPGEPMLAAVRRQAATSAPAERLGPFDETMGLRIGSMYASSFETMASLDSDFGIGTSVRLENEIDMDDNTESFRADLYWRIGRHHRVDLGWFDLERSGTRTIERDIRWGELEFDVGASVTAELQTEVIPLRYTYNFLAGEDHELGLGIGIYGMLLRASMRGEVSAGSGGSGGGVALEDTETFRSPVPLPVFSLQGGWAFADRFRAIALLQYFYIHLQDDIGELDEIEGSILDGSVGIEYDATDHVCIGTSVNWFRFHAMAREEPLELDVQYDFAGLFLYLGLRF